MSDPQPLPGRKKPQRAEPIQPDLPGSGDQTQSDAQDASPHTDAAAAAPSPQEPGGSSKVSKQSSDALKNVREGYS